MSARLDLNISSFFFNFSPSFICIVLDSESHKFFPPVAETLPCRAALTVRTYSSAGRALQWKADVAKGIRIMCFFCTLGLMLTFPDRLWMRLDTYAAPGSPPEDVFDFFVHVYILSPSR